MDEGAGTGFPATAEMTVPSVRVRGIDRALRKMNKEIRRHERTVQDNVLRAGFFLFREAQKVVPIDTGNLAGSGSVLRDPVDRDQVNVTYDAAYALAVHERRKGKFKRPSARRKWLESTLNEWRDSIIRIAKTGR